MARVGFTAVGITKHIDLTDKEVAGVIDHASGSVTSEKLAVAAIVSGHLGAGAVISGAVASGQVGTYHVASGAVKVQNLYTDRAVLGQLGWKPQLANEIKKKVLDLASGENKVCALGYDGTNLYAGLYTTPGKVVKIDPVSMSGISTLTLASGENKVYSLGYDGTNLYAGLNTTPGKVVRKGFI